MVDNAQTSRQAVSGPKLVRGINWTQIFEQKPELKPPGYEETVQYINTKSRLRGEG